MKPRNLLWSLAALLCAIIAVPGPALAQQNPEPGPVDGLAGITHSQSAIDMARKLVNEAPEIQIELRTSVQGIVADPVSMVAWHRTGEPNHQRYRWDYRGLVDPTLESQELAADIAHLVSVMAEGPSDAGVYIALPLLRTAQFEYPSECRTSGTETVRSTFDESFPSVLARTIDRTPESDVWRSEVFGDVLPTGLELLGDVTDSSRGWSRSEGWFLLPCIPTEHAVSYVDDMIANLEAGTTLELDEVGRPIRLTTTRQSFGYIPSEYGPVEIEVLISYAVTQFSMPDERDIHGSASDIHGSAPSTLPKGVYSVPVTEVSIGEIQRLYRTVFGRDADESGLLYWVGVANAGATYDDLTWAFLASEEWVAAVGAGNSDAEFVERLYGQAFGRPADTSGLSYWVDDVLAGGVGQWKIIRWFAESQEQINAIEPVQPLYLVGRKSDGFDLDTKFGGIDGATLCVAVGLPLPTVGQLTVRIIELEDRAQVIDAFIAGICDVITTDGSNVVPQLVPPGSAWVRFPLRPIATR